MTLSIRLGLHPTKATARQPRHCEAVEKGVECGKVTREGKPFCSDHVEHHDYVQRLIAHLNQLEAEEERVKLRGVRAARLDSPLMVEVVRVIMTLGCCTEARLCKETQLDPKAVGAYVMRLIRERVGEQHVTKRGDRAIKINTAAWREHVRRRRQSSV